MILISKIGNEIQPININSENLIETSRVDSAQPIFKSRLRRLFDQQFSSVLRISYAQEKPTATKSPPQQQHYSTSRMEQLSPSLPSSSRARISAEQKEKKMRREEEGNEELARGNDGGSRHL
ncbi:hypothetical protein ACFX1Q_024189 [Malus domestica]